PPRGPAGGAAPGRGRGGADPGNPPRGGAPPPARGGGQGGGGPRGGGGGRPAPPPPRLDPAELRPPLRRQERARVAVDDRERAQPGAQAAPLLVVRHDEADDGAGQRRIGGRAPEARVALGPLAIPARRDARADTGVPHR